MLTIKDLSASKELDVKAMSEVRGGGDVFSTNGQGSSQSAVAGLVAVNDSTQNLLSSNTAFDYTRCAEHAGRYRRERRPGHLLDRLIEKRQTARQSGGLRASVFYCACR